MALVLPLQNRAAGVYQIPAAQVPNRLDNHRVTCTMNVADADASNTANHIDILVEYTNDPAGLTGWNTLISFGWNGGIDARTGLRKNNPTASLSSADPVPVWVRGQITTNFAGRWSVDNTIGND